MPQIILIELLIMSSCAPKRTQPGRLRVFNGWKLPSASDLSPQLVGISEIWSCANALAAAIYESLAAGGRERMCASRRAPPSASASFGETALPGLISRGEGCRVFVYSYARKGHVVSPWRITTLMLRPQPPP